VLAASIRKSIRISSASVQPCRQLDGAAGAG
jgi:hypothetical protein